MARKPELKPYYRLSELAELMDMSRGRALRLLTSVGIQRRRLGGLKVIFVSDIRDHMPVLWRSIVACEQARSVARAMSRLDRSL